MYVIFVTFHCLEFSFYDLLDWKTKLRVCYIELRVEKIIGMQFVLRNAS